MDYLFILKIIFIMDSFIKIKNMEMGLLIILMVINIMENLKMIKYKEKENILLKIN